MRTTTAGDGEFLSKSALKKRGFTDSLIERFLKQPDERRPNPKYRSTEPMHLYLLRRVEAVEASIEYQEALAKSRDRSARAKVAADQRRQRLLSKIADLPVPALPELSEIQLLDKAIEHYNLEHLDSSNRATINDDQAFLGRIAVNFSRHMLTGYKHELDRLRGQVGREEATQLVRATILDAIEAKYPWLVEDCDRQRARYDKEAAETLF